jgi:AcrR family transcriptional regulator
MTLFPPVASKGENVYDVNMSDKGNAVNIEPTRRGYHHGDLKAALIAAGIELLKTRSAEALSLREVARAVGVSATAVYRHFPDKQALLYAICEQTSEALARVQIEAMRGAVNTREGFVATGRAYVRFALANPAAFRLMMATRPPQRHFGADAELATAAMRVLRENVSALLPDGASPTDHRLAAIHAWSLTHGMAMLMLDGQIPMDEEIIESIRTPPMG